MVDEVLCAVLFSGGISCGCQHRLDADISSIRNNLHVGFLVFAGPPFSQDVSALFFGLSGTILIHGTK